MADTSQQPTPQQAEPPRASQPDGVEKDLDTVDAALAALDSGDLEGAESLAAELESPGASGPAPAHEDDRAS